MFTRIVECHVKPEKREELTNKRRNELLQILQKQSGFVDEIGLTHETDPERVVGISFWKTKEHAERYHRQHFNRILDTLKPLLKTIPKADTYNVETSTPRRIAGKAA